MKFIKNNQLKNNELFLSKIRVLPDSMSFRDEFKIIKIKDSLNLLMYVRENFKLNLFDILKYYFYFMKYNLKLILSIVNNLKFYRNLRNGKLFGRVVQW